MKSIRPNGKAFLLGMALIFFGLPFLSASENPLPRVEGVIYDEHQSSESIAIIDGEYLREGGSLGDYAVQEIRPKHVVLVRHQSQEAISVEVEGKRPEPVEEAPSDLELVEGEKKNFWTSIKNALSAPVRYGFEMKALYNLAIFNNACVNYYNQMGYFPRTVKQLISIGFLSDSWEEPEEFKYRYYFEPVDTPHQFRLHADPLDPKLGLKYFYVDQDAIIRVSKDGPASHQSPAHQYPGRKADNPTDGTS